MPRAAGEVVLHRQAQALGKDTAIGLVDHQRLPRARRQEPRVEPAPGLPQPPLLIDAKEVMKVLNQSVQGAAEATAPLVTRLDLNRIAQAIGHRCGELQHLRIDLAPRLFVQRPEVDPRARAAHLELPTAQGRWGARLHGEAQGLEGRLRTEVQRSVAHMRKAQPATPIAPRRPDQGGGSPQNFRLLSPQGRGQLLHFVPADQPPLRLAVGVEENDLGHRHHPIPPGQTGIAVDVDFDPDPRSACLPHARIVEDVTLHLVAVRTPGRPEEERHPAPGLRRGNPSGLHFPVAGRRPGRFSACRSPQSHQEQQEQPARPRTWQRPAEPAVRRHHFFHTRHCPVGR